MGSNASTEQKAAGTGMMLGGILLAVLVPGVGPVIAGGALISAGGAVASGGEPRIQIGVTYADDGRGIMPYVGEPEVAIRVREAVVAQAQVPLLTPASRWTPTVERPVAKDAPADLLERIVLPPVTKVPLKMQRQHRMLFRARSIETELVAPSKNNRNRFAVAMAEFERANNDMKKSLFGLITHTTEFLALVCARENDVRDAYYIDYRVNYILETKKIITQYFRNIVFTPVFVPH